MEEHSSSARSAAQILASAGIDVIRAYEDAATAIGRLDASGRLSAPGLRELLVLRCIATPDAAASDSMIALVHGDGERDEQLRIYGAAVRDGAARARGGVLPSTAALHELLRTPARALTGGSFDELLRDSRERTPPVLKAALAAMAIREGAAGSEREMPRLAALAVTLVLCVGGATTDAWLSLPAPRVPADLTLRGTFAALAREARTAERGLAAARELGDADEARVRDSLGRAAYSALDVLALLRERIVISVPETARALGQTPPTTGAAVARLVELGIAREATGKARSRAFAYEGMVRALQPEQAVRT